MLLHECCEKNVCAIVCREHDCIMSHMSIQLFQDYYKRRGVTPAHIAQEKAAKAAKAGPVGKIPWTQKETDNWIKGPKGLGGPWTKAAWDKVGCILRDLAKRPFLKSEDGSSVISPPHARSDETVARYW